MPYEVTCPSCQARCLVRDEAGAGPLLCPRCLKPVPHPDGGTVREGLPPYSAPVPSVESEATVSTWRAYFVILALMVLAVIGIVVGAAMEPGPRPEINVWPLLCCFGVLIVFLPFLIIYPIMRSASALTWTRTKNTGIIVLLLILLPLAAFILLGIVCAVLELT